MLISKNIRVQLTEEEKKTLRDAAIICNELGDAIGEAIANYGIDIAEIYDTLYRISYEDNFEYIEEEG